MGELVPERGVEENLRDVDVSDPPVSIQLNPCGVFIQELAAITEAAPQTQRSRSGSRSRSGPNPGAGPSRRCRSR